MVKALHALPLGLSLLQRPRRERRADSLSEWRKRVLIVVEDRLAGKHLAGLLGKMGYERVRIVRRAASALLLSQQHSPSIVFLDLALTDDVHALASTLRRQSERSSLRLIALASGTEPLLRERIRDGGFERWLVMPVAKTELDGLMRDETTAPV